jgi:hypothetical protein
MQSNSHYNHHQAAQSHSPGWFADNANPSAQHMFNDAMIIPPPESKEAIEKRRTVFLAVDSRDRNHRDFPESNSYSIPLDCDLMDVESIQLVSHNIPSPQFTIRSSNNAICLATLPPSINSTTLAVDYFPTSTQEIRIEPGYYQESDSIGERVPTGTGGVASAADAFAAALQVDYGGRPLLQDKLATQMEAALNADTTGQSSTYVVHMVSSSRYVFVTDFSNPFPAADVYSEPVFFRMFFRGDDEFYGASTMEKVNVSSDPCNPVYETKKIGKTQPTYKKDSVAPLIGFKREDIDNQLTGTVAVDASDPTLLVGSGTQFRSELRKGDWIYVAQVDDNASYRLKILEVTSDTSCCIGSDDPASPDPPTISSALAWCGRIEAPWARNLSNEPYMVMRVRECDTLMSYNNTINKAFYLVPTERSAFTETREYMPFKKFTPAKGRLDKLSIRFENVDGTLYDFMGRDHLMLFKIVRFKQNISYGDF